VREGASTFQSSPFSGSGLRVTQKESGGNCTGALERIDGIPFSFQDLRSPKLLEIVERNIELEDYGTFWMKSGFLKKFLELEDYGVAIGLDLSGRIIKRVINKAKLLNSSN